MKEEFSLEKTIQRIKEILSEMQSEKIDFDKNVELFKEGTELIRQSQDFLDESELMIKELTDKQD